MTDGTYVGLARAVLVAHQRTSTSDCLCGGLDPGDSWSVHVARILDAAGALNRPPADRLRGIRTGTLIEEVRRRDERAGRFFAMRGYDVELAGRSASDTEPDAPEYVRVRCDAVAPDPWAVRCTYDKQHTGTHGADLPADGVSDAARSRGAEASWLRWSDGGHVEEDAILPDDDVYRIHHDPGDSR